MATGSSAGAGLGRPKGPDTHLPLCQCGGSLLLWGALCKVLEGGSRQRKEKMALPFSGPRKTLRWKGGPWVLARFLQCSLSDGCCARPAQSKCLLKALANGCRAVPSLSPAHAESWQDTGLLG